jgi:cell division protein FtsX
MSGLRSWYALGKWPFILRFASVGAFAGLASWVLAYALHWVFDISKPSTMALVWAVPRGALYGVILALILWMCWSRTEGR